MDNTEIKFRAWFPEGHWVTEKYGRMITKYTRKTIFEMFGFWESDTQYMQYIGIKDSSGQDIYEGDIIRTYFEEDEQKNYQYHEVVWGGKDYPAFHLKPGFQDTMNDFSYLVCATEAPRFDVAGNIYEDEHLKDLLEE